MPQHVSSGTNGGDVEFDSVSHSGDSGQREIYHVAVKQATNLYTAEMQTTIASYRILLFGAKFLEL